MLRPSRPAGFGGRNEVKRRWAARDMAGEVCFLTAMYVGDANSYVSSFRAGSDRVALVG